MKKIIVSTILLAGILLFGTFGYMTIEGASPLDAMYMTVITITTVGFSEIVPLHPIGKVFTMVLIVIGAGFMLYLFSEVTEAMVEGGLQRIYGRGSMEKKVAVLKKHFIVCGFGRIGRVICKILQENNRPFVVIEKDPVELQKLNELGYLSLEGEASADEVLLKAGINDANGLIAVVTSDADNVYIALTARGLKPDLFIMARSSGEEGAETKLLRAGANKVISPYYIGACRMAQQVVRPTVIDFIDLAVNTSTHELGLRLEELVVSSKAKMANMPLQNSGIRKKYDLIVVAIKREDGEMLFNPNPQSMVLPGDIMVVLGEQKHIKGLEQEL
ncbi:MAG: potassium channel protein [Desulfobulbaceae bacterium]|nr:potassium channel protein [Desulfobulbaceae bacterium]